MGFDKEQVVVVPMLDQNTRKAYRAIKSEFIQSPSIIGVTASSSVPGKSVTNISYRAEGTKEDGHYKMDTFFIDYDFLETLDIKLASGRNFSREFSTDETSAFILNETAVRQIGWDNPINKQIIWPRDLRRSDRRGCARPPPR